MRYVRFLKPPRIVHDKNRPSAHVSCLITITSDLGDSFLPYPLTLSAELIQDVSRPDFSRSVAAPPGTETLDTNNITVWKTIQWKAGMRSLLVTLPLSRNYRNNNPFVVRIGTEPKSTSDEFDKLLHQDTRGVVSAWSAPFNLTSGSSSPRTVERRLQVGPHTHRILEETDESIARHLWDAGVTLSCHLPYLLTSSGVFDKVLRSAHRRQHEKDEQRLHVYELGTGCGIVGITLAHLISKSDVLLTDLPQARAIAVRNIELSNGNRKNAAAIDFQELDWDNPLPNSLDDSMSESRVDLILAADCTYNADSSPALVNTILQIAARSPHVTIAIAMKRRHSSEDIFFELMSQAKFQPVNTICFPLPGDEKAGEETMELYLYEYFAEYPRASTEG